MTIDFKSNRFEITATVDVREAPDQTVVEIEEMFWINNGKYTNLNVRDLVIDLISNNEQDELHQLIIEAHENNL